MLHRNKLLLIIIIVIILYTHPFVCLSQFVTSLVKSNLLAEEMKNNFDYYSIFNIIP